MMIHKALILGAKRQQTTRGMELLLSSAANYIALGLLPSSSSFTPPLHHHKYRLLSSSTSSTSDEYDLFFPSFYREYMRHRIDWYAYREQIEEPISLGYSYAEPSYSQPMSCPDFEDTAHYTCDSVEPLNIHTGQHFDVISLLSTHADDLVRIGKNNTTTDLVKANDLRGKYILLCCGFVPSVWIDATSHHWRELSLFSSELYIAHDDVEVVIVPKMRQKWADDEGVFHHFFSAFPRCLTLPFSHKYRRDYICKSLNFDKTTRLILVDPSQRVVNDRLFELCMDGARAFPFTDERALSIFREDCWDEPRPPSLNSLAGLLGCQSNPSSFLLHKFDSEEETISVEQLNKHLVGIYLLKLGDELCNFGQIYKQCKFEGLDFEIVLVCLPFSSPIHPDMYQDVVLCALKRFGVSNWWLLPFNNSTSRRLCNLTANPCCDSMFIVGPHNKFVARQGGEAVSLFSFHFGTEAYPFTLEALLQVLLQRLEAVTLESFLRFDHIYRDYECDDSKMMHVSKLKGKNVLVCVIPAASLKPSCADVIENVIKWYDIIKEKDSDFEVVLVPVIDPSLDIDYPSFCAQVRECLSNSKTKWLVCPFHDPKYHRYLMNHEAFLLTRGTYLAKKGVPVPSVLAFGEDGHLHSLNALRLIEEAGINNAYPFRPESRNSSLYSDLETNLCYEFDIWDY